MRCQKRSGRTGKIASPKRNAVASSRILMRDLREEPHRISPCADFGKNCGRSGAEGKRFGFESGEVENFRGVLDIDPDDLSLFIEIDDHAVLNFARIDARPRVQIDVERVGFAIVVELHVDPIMKPGP